jgi:hypothetical protein
MTLTIFSECHFVGVVKSNEGGIVPIERESASHHGAGIEPDALAFHRFLLNMAAQIH